MLDRLRHGHPRQAQARAKCLVGRDAVHRSRGVDKLMLKEAPSTRCFFQPMIALSL